MTRGLVLLLLLSQFWCPMHPDERADARGKCSICGMTLDPPARKTTRKPIAPPRVHSLPMPTSR